MSIRTETTMRCDHCGGTVHIARRAGRLVYTCDGCGCRWTWGMVITHKGQSCPTHGTDLERGLALATGSPGALLAYARAELERAELGDDAGDPDDPDYVPF